MYGKYGVPWRGMKVHIIDGSIYQLMGERKWAKTRLIIKKWLQRVACGEPLDYTEFQSDQGLLNYLFDTYMSCRPFLKVMHPNLDYWIPHRDYEGWKQDPDGMDSDLSEDNLGDEAGESLGKITGSPSKGDAAEKGEPKTVRSAQRWFSELQVLKRLTRDNDPPLKPVCPTQIELDRYGLVDSSKGGFGSVIRMPKEGIDGM